MDYISREEGVVLKATPSFFSDYLWEGLSNSMIYSNMPCNAKYI